MSRLRVTAVQIQVQAFNDDGENLTPVPVEPITVPYSAWAAFDLEAALAPLREQIEAPAAPPSD